MASQPIPAPPMQQQPDGDGPGPGGGFPSPAPAQGDQQAAQLLMISQGIVASARMIANKVPGATAEVRQINDLVARIQGKIKQGQAPTETQAPPV